MPSAAELMKTAVSAAFAPVEVLHVDEWADRYRIIDAKGTRWRTETTPYMRRPMRCFTHPQVRHITMMCGSQVSKTEGLFLNCLAYTIDCDPQTSIAMFPIPDDGVEFNQERLMPSILATERLRRHLRPSPRDEKVQRIRFDRMTLFLVGSNTKRERRSRPAPRIFLDEVSAYSDPGYIEIYDRVKAGDGSHKIVDCSTPDDENIGIDVPFRQGSKEHYFVPCPHCAAYQILRFKNLKWEGGAYTDQETAKATAKYLCEKCRTPCYEFHKPAMLSRGLWVPESRSIEDVLEHGEGSIRGAGGVGRSSKTGVERQHVSFQISSMYSPFLSSSWGEMAAVFVKSRGMRTREFVCGWEGVPWADLGDRTDIGEVRRLCTPASEGGYRLGEVPKGVLAIVRGIDIQKHWAYVVDRGFGVGGRDTWLINFMQVPRQDGLRLADVWPQLPKAYKRIGSTEMLPVAFEFIDSGHFTDDVYRGVASRRRDGVKCFPVKGKGGTTQLSAPYSLSPIEKMSNGEVIKLSVRLVLVNSDYWKTAVTSRIKGTAVVAEDADAPMKIGAGEVPGFYLPEVDEGGRMEMYFDQVTAEHRKLEQGKPDDKKPKYPKYVWQMRQGRYQNHAFDAECYAFCGAELVGVRRLGAVAAAPVKREASGESWVSAARR